MVQANEVHAEAPEAGVPVTVTVLVPRVRPAPVINPAGEIAWPAGTPAVR